MCEESHEALKSIFNNCPFCDFSFVEIVKTNVKCCNSMNIVEDESIRRCTNCYWFDYPCASEYINYYENRHRIRRKSVYIRKYQFFKTINLFTHDIMWDEKLMLYKIFESLQESIDYIIKIRAGSKRTRSIKFTFLIRKILKMKGDELYHYFPLPKTKMTILRYEKLTYVPLKLLSNNSLFIQFSRRHHDDA